MKKLLWIELSKDGVCFVLMDINSVLKFKEKDKIENIKN